MTSQRDRVRYAALSTVVFAVVYILLSWVIDRTLEVNVSHLAAVVVFFVVMYLIAPHIPRVRR